jgi:hypothetical protein
MNAWFRWEWNACTAGVDQEGRAVIQQTRRISLIITPAAKATAAATTPVATAGKSSALWTSFIHCEGTPFQGLSVKSLDRALHVFVVAKFNEAKPPGFTRHLVADNRCGNNLKPSVGHKFAEHTIGHTAGKVPHE